MDIMIVLFVLIAIIIVCAIYVTNKSVKRFVAREKSKSYMDGFEKGNKMNGGCKRSK